MKKSPSELSLAKVVDSLRVLLDVSEDELFSKKRTGNVALCRQLGMWFARKQGMTFQHVGRLFSRHPSNVIYADRRIEELIPIDANVRDLIEKSGA